MNSQMPNKALLPGAMAIVFEIIAALSLRFSSGFTKIIPCVQKTGGRSQLPLILEESVI